MNVYTYSEARQRLSSVLDSAKASGEVLIRRKDGATFSLKPKSQNQSPLDIIGIQTDITTKEIISFIRESRRA